MTTLSPSALYCAYLRKSRKDIELEALGHGETLYRPASSTDVGPRVSGESCRDAAALSPSVSVPDTLTRHEQALRDLADRLGIRIAATYREVVSGDTIAERPEVRRLLEDVNAGLWDGVLVMDVDRLGRGDSIDQGVIMQSFLYSNTLIITPDKVYDPSDDSDAEFFEIKLFFSRREYNMIKKRMQRGRLASAMDGCYMGSRPVYGYERVKLQGRKGWSLKVVPEKAEIVRAVFDWYAHGLDGREIGTVAIAGRLNDMGLRTDLGALFEASYIRHMLQNPIYIGKVRWNHRQTVYRIEDGKRVKSRPLSDNEVLVDGHHEAIIDRALWDEVQAIFASHGKRPVNARARITNPLAGLLVCGCCGRHLQYKPSPNRPGNFVGCRTHRCPTCSAYISAVEDAVLAVLQSWVSEFRADAAAALDHGDPAAAAAAALQQLRDQRDGLNAQLDRLYDLLEQGVYSVREFRQRREELNARLAQIDDAIAGLGAAPKPDPRIALIPQVCTVLDAYAAAPDAETKNALLRSVIDRVIYHKTKRGYRNNKPGDFLSIEVFPRLPSDHPDL